MPDAKRDLQLQRSLTVFKAVRSILPDRIRIEHFIDRIVGNRRREEITLSVLALEGSKLAELLCAADPFRLRAYADDLRKSQDGAPQPQVLVVRVHRAHQVAIDLDGVDRKTMEIDERGVARPVVVQIHLRSELLDLRQERHRST